MYVANRDDNNIIKITPQLVASVFAGNISGHAGFLDGIGTSALINQPVAICVDNNGLAWIMCNNGYKKTLNLTTAQVLTP